MKFNKATKKQVDAARKFGERLGISVSQAVKYLDECFKASRGEITPAEFKEKTGHEWK